MFLDSKSHPRHYISLAISQSTLWFKDDEFASAFKPPPLTPFRSKTIDKGRGHSKGQKGIESKNICAMKGRQSLSWNDLLNKNIE